MSFDLIIKNGTVILENEARVVDIAVKGGKIAAIGQDLGDAKEVMDASGLVVSPGMVDAHTHISEPGRSHWEGYENRYSRSGKSGITTMIEMPLNQLPATVDRASIELKFDAAKGKLTIDAAQLGGLGVLTTSTVCMSWMKWALSASNASLRPVAIAVSTTTSVM
ncbi:allantoinase [Escherichia coli]|uniref:Allantoinase n=1 Tax=Escherichia coli TaxID=562 RepID=A0A377B206_ECOLX|nr:allantoinase [Escherichia coli]